MEMAVAAGRFLVPPPLALEQKCRSMEKHSPHSFSSPAFVYVALALAPLPSEQHSCSVELCVNDGGFMIPASASYGRILRRTMGRWWLLAHSPARRRSTSPLRSQTLKFRLSVDY
ncbi:hypothetical protein PVAP13_2KG303004 [Panicum virgatum]|uniref:Uncharacterized protein n=1 Tax=Panicum virgatum TaxID=38727 RepID=A0A8T0W7Y5_PANVG|nr:hypothetical protein PVAP13_2KG303004 [Panicum virgatum]